MHIVFKKFKTIRTFANDFRNTIITMDMESNEQGQLKKKLKNYL